jgi:hypothetical protein
MKEGKFNILFIHHLFFRSESRGGGGGGGGERKTVAITDHITKDNKDKTLVLKGMPFKATEGEVKEFFEGFDLDTDDSVYLEQENGMTTLTHTTHMTTHTAWMTRPTPTVTTTHTVMTTLTPATPMTMLRTSPEVQVLSTREDYDNAKEIWKGVL